MSRRWLSIPLLATGLLISINPAPVMAAGCVDVAGTNLHVGEAVLNEPVITCVGSSSTTGVTLKVEGSASGFFARNTALGFLSGAREAPYSSPSIWPRHPPDPASVCSEIGPRLDKTYVTICVGAVVRVRDDQGNIQDCDRSGWARPRNRPATSLSGNAPSTGPDL